MPVGLVDALTNVEFADLIAYLGSLRGLESPDQGTKHPAPPGQSP